MVGWQRIARLGVALTTLATLATLAKRCTSAAAWAGAPRGGRRPFGAGSWDSLEFS